MVSTWYVFLPSLSTIFFQCRKSIERCFLSIHFIFQRSIRNMQIIFILSILFCLLQNFKKLTLRRYHLYSQVVQWSVKLVMQTEGKERKLQGLSQWFSFLGNFLFYSGEESETRDISTGWSSVSSSILDAWFQAGNFKSTWFICGELETFADFCQAFLLLSFFGIFFV